MSTTTIRKSVYGRTDLFLPSATSLVRDIRTCALPSVRDAHRYHTLQCDPDRPVLCWHCCETIEGDRVPIPRSHDASANVFFVHGAACSPECAKAYLIEHVMFDRGNHLNTFHRMMCDVYGIVDPIVETPPRAMLKKFGGLFDPKITGHARRLSLVEPPFVSYCMIADELAGANVASEAPAMDVEGGDELEEPTSPPLFKDYAERMDVASEKPPVEPTKRRRSETARHGGGGPIDRFVT